MNIATAKDPVDLLDCFERRLAAAGWVLHSAGGGVADWLPGTAGDDYSGPMIQIPYRAVTDWRDIAHQADVALQIIEIQP
jgi:hypothetical protein